MKLDGKSIWQVAGGDTDRSYVDLFVHWDVIAMGPGRFGPWPNCQVPALAHGFTGRKMTDVRRFHESIKSGDIIILRLGTSQVYAVGEAVGDETIWLDDFGDIDGWDLQHVRRVKWLWTSADEPQTFPSHTLKWGDIVQKMSSDEVRSWLSALQIERSDQDRELRQLPASCEHAKSHDEADMKRAADFLFDQGIAAQSIDGLVEQMDELARVARWYQRTSQSPSESETIAYLVVPLLRTLGWTPQKMAVEWNYVDVALFGRTPRCNEHLRAVVEVKKMNNSCLTAKSQAESYALEKGRADCLQLIVTDGLRYAIFIRDRDQDEFDSKPVAYLNLTRLRESYPILECRGVRTALLMLAADWNGDVSFVEKIEESDKMDAMWGELIEQSTIDEDSST